ncbi:ParB/RepB/Spo0J family partition protein [Arthrobacter sp. 260]|uniref:ParB/RepB/Spo0J family partition protein n=1 Tax=Arthrobacter sp. 260 TaxID=2735314 RepID=UPI001490B116|nr:ParB/RepB/Spo0J family partition protein [Arthrobacter sp. 260]NOJ59267.1 ParB/RepB/Spo0J family partition protein [Arthrobacter sp. 260]
MVEKRRGLGRGLGALIPSAPASEPAETAESPAPRSGRPADMFFPAAPERGARAADRDTSGGSSTRTGSGINKEALRAPTRESKRNSPKRAGATASRDKTTRRPEAANKGETASAPIGREAPEQDTENTEFTPGEESGLPTETMVSPSAVEADVNENTGADDTPTAESVSEVVPGGDGVSRETTVAESGPVLMTVPGATFAEIQVDLIHANRKQPRSVFDEDEMAELVNSIREIGVLQPIVVRPSSEGGDQPYELVMGERRWRATREAGLDAVPAIIRSTTDDDLLRDALLENLHRSQLNPLEEAAAYRQLLDDFGCSHDELAERIGRSRPQISNTLRLMKLPPLVQRRLAAGIISAGHARALLGLSDQVEMEKLAQKIVAEGLSVRTTEELVSMNDGLRRPVKSSSPRAGARHERLDYLATSLSDRLDTNVKITLGARKGKVSIEFASVDDLNRIMGVLGSGQPSQ